MLFSFYKILLKLLKLLLFSQQTLHKVYGNWFSISRKVMCEKNWEVGSISFAWVRKNFCRSWEWFLFLNFCINSENCDRFLVLFSKKSIRKVFLPEYFVIDNSSRFIFNYCLYNRFHAFLSSRKIVYLCMALWSLSEVKCNMDIKRKESFIAKVATSPNLWSELKKELTKKLI